jgi:hypothetical protein
VQGLFLEKKTYKSRHILREKSHKLPYLDNALLSNLCQMWFIPLVHDHQSIYLVDKIETQKKKKIPYSWDDYMRKLCKQIR